MTENSELDKLFKDRYTENDERYRKINENGFEKVIVLHPWDPRRNNQSRRRGRGNYHRDGGGNSNRGGWVPRGGGYRGGHNTYEDRGGYRQQWRGEDRRRRYND